MNARLSLRALAPLLVAAGLISACSDDPVRPGTHTPPLVPILWSQIRGGIGVGAMHAVWGSSPENMYAVCDDGVLKSDGSGWRLESIPSADTLHAVWGAAAGTVFAAGEGGVILIRSGGVWSEMVSPTSLDIRSLHGTSANDVYAVAATHDSPDAAELLHFDGSAWSHVDTKNGVDGNAVCAVSGMVFVACDGGVMLRYDGADLTEDDTLVNEDLNGVWAASAADAHAVGANGRVLHWDGGAWTPLTSGVTAGLYAVSGSAAGNVIAVGDGGTVLHHDGSAWGKTPSGTSLPLRGACVFADGRAVACGFFGTVLAGSGTLWAPDHLGQLYSYEGVWSADTYYIAVGTGPLGGVIRDRDGNGWDVPEGLHAVSGFSSSYAFAAGDGGVVYRYDGSNWEKQVTPLTATVRGLTALVTRFGEPFRVYAAGDDGSLAVWKAGTWSIATTPAGAENHRFVDVWAAAIDDVFAVADNATSLVRYDDPYEVAAWTLEETPATAPLLAVGGVRGDVYIVSEAGEIFFNNGGGWVPLASPVTTPLRDIRALEDDSIFAVGDHGVIVHFDGVSWTRVDSGFVGTLNSIWGAEGRSVFAVGADGAVLLHED